MNMSADEDLTTISSKTPVCKNLTQNMNVEFTSVRNGKTDQDAKDKAAAAALAALEKKCTDFAKTLAKCEKGCDDKGTEGKFKADAKSPTTKILLQGFNSNGVFTVKASAKVFGVCTAQRTCSAPTTQPL